MRDEETYRRQVRRILVFFERNDDPLIITDFDQGELKIEYGLELDKSGMGKARISRNGESRGQIRWWKGCMSYDDFAERTEIDYMGRKTRVRK